MTMQEMEIVNALFTGDYEGTCLVKNLYLYDKKKKERAWLVCAASDTNIDMKALTKNLGVGSGNLRGGSEESMWERLGAKKGALSLFAIINDKDKKEIELILDKRITEEFKHVGFHPMDNTATTAITKESMMKIA